MLGIHVRAARIAWTVFLVALLLGTCYLIRRTLLIFVVALFFAYMLSPVVALVERFTPTRFSRTLALTIVYVLLVAALVLAGMAIGSKVAEETSNLAAKLPQLLQSQAVYSWKLPEWLAPYRDHLLQMAQSLRSGSEQVLPLLKQAGQGLLALLGNLGFAVLVPILSFFFLKDGTEIRQAILREFGDGARGQLVEEILSDVHTLLGQYIRALVLLSLATFTAYSLFFSLLGIPYAILLATLAAALEFIPVVGPLSGILIACIVSMTMGYGHFLWLLCFFAAYRIFQDYMLQPYVMSSGVALHPLLIIFGALAGEQIGGIPGMVLSVPVMATLRVVYVRAHRARVPRHSPAGQE